MRGSLSTIRSGHDPSGRRTQILDPPWKGFIDTYAPKAAAQSQYMEKFLYLNETSFARAWLDGGEVPLYRSSRYRDARREGTRTPDELQHSHFNVDPGKVTSMEGDMTWINCTIFSDPYLPPTIMSGRQWVEDGVVLCLSSSAPHWDTMTRLGKACCVKIKDVRRLKSSLDEQMGSFCEMRDCEYTWGWNRNPFLKSKDDAWQSEYRLFWKNAESRSVTIEKNMASSVILWKGMWHSGTFFR